MGLIKTLRIDFRANAGNSKGRVIVLAYRLANFIYYHNNLLIRILGYPVRKMYHWIFIWILGVEIPEKVRIGAGLQVWHGTGLVINHECEIGDYVLLRQCTTIGNKKAGCGVPRIGNYVEVGANSCIIGDIHIGDNVIIGCGAVVTKSVPNAMVAIGNPARIICSSKLKDAPSISN